MLIKASFSAPLSTVPRLMAADGDKRRDVGGTMTDSRGRFWQFHVDGLSANRNHLLQILEGNGAAMTDPWPLKTFPAPEEAGEHLRILSFTCGGGNERLKLEDGMPFFLSMASRHRLIMRGLSFRPDVVISNGDHVYWDQMTTRRKPVAFKKPWLELFEEYGALDPAKPVLGTSNESILARIADDQIAALYGVRFRSVPVYMLTDDHDMFENDEANDDFTTLPPSKHLLDAARTTQRLYYPEFLPDRYRSPWLAGSSAPDRAQGLSEVYGTLRYGKLFEALLYDTKRYATIAGPSARLVPEHVENWLAERSASADTHHLVHIPSTPVGWSAGKWGEWYPDVLQKDGMLGIETPKPYWPAGWWSQHQRILKMLHQQKNRIPLILSGDLHALASGRIIKSGSLDLGKNPVHSICVGPLGSSGPGFPSQYRGTPPLVPSQLGVEESLAPIEKNGFSVIDVTPSTITIRMYAWRPPEPVERIDMLRPINTIRLTSPA